MPRLQIGPFTRSKVDAPEDLNLTNISIFMNSAARCELSVTGENFPAIDKNIGLFDLYAALHHSIIDIFLLDRISSFMIEDESFLFIKKNNSSIKFYFGDVGPSFLIGETDILTFSHDVANITAQIYDEAQRLGDTLRIFAWENLDTILSRLVKF